MLMPSRCVIAVLCCFSACAEAQVWIPVGPGIYDQLSASDPCYGSTSPFPTCYSTRSATLPLQFGLPRDGSGNALPERVLDANCYRPGAPVPAQYWVDRYPQQRLDAPVSTM